MFGGFQPDAFQPSAYQNEGLEAFQCFVFQPFAFQNACEIAPADAFQCFAFQPFAFQTSCEVEDTGATGGWPAFYGRVPRKRKAPEQFEALPEIVKAHAQNEARKQVLARKGDQVPPVLQPELGYDIDVEMQPLYVAYLQYYVKLLEEEKFVALTMITLLLQ